MIAFLSLTLLLAPFAQTTTGNLQIVVIEGENAVNIIQQKTAVAPIVEVRDRNHQPVAGATVRFVVQGGRATFGGAQTLTVTTNAAGQAVAGAFTPVSSGAVQISATAAFQGQTAIATIAQTNVMTAAEIAAGASAGAGAGAGGSATGASTAAAGGSGGISATTLGVVGAAVGGGALAATQLGGSEETVVATAPPPPPPPPPAPTRFALSGAYTGRGQRTNTATNPSDFNPCTETLDFAGTLSMALEQAPTGGGVTGTGTTTMRHTIVGLSPSCPADMMGRVTTVSWNLTIEGNTQSLTFDARSNWSVSTQSGVYQLRFAGRLENGTVSGTMLWNETFGGTIPGTRPIAFTGLGSGTMDVVLRASTP